MLEKFTDWLIRWRIAILVATVLVVLLSAAGGRNLVFSNDYRAYFSEENPQLQAFEALQNTYTKTDNVLIAIAPKNSKVFKPQTLATIEWLTKESWRLPYATRVDSITNFQHTHARGDELVVRDLVANAASLSQAELDRAQQIALAEPLLGKRLLSAKADVAGVNVVIELPEKNLDEVPEVMTAVHKLVDQLRARDNGVDVYVTGAVPIDNGFGEQARKDLVTLTPLMYVVILLVTFLILRSGSSVLATVLIITFASVSAMGIAGWMGIRLTPPSVGAPTVILTLAVAHSIHMLVSIVHGMRNGMDKHAAIVESVKLNLYPITIASLTDVIGEKKQLVPEAWKQNAAKVTFDAKGKPTLKLPDIVPPSSLLLKVLRQGDGDVVKDGDTVTVDYQGTNWRTGKIFDQSYGKQPASFATDQVVPGFGAALVGQKVGTRLVVSIPSKYGYGETGNESAGIKGTDTLFFVVDILAAS